jgi:hypothetical protein
MASRLLFNRIATSARPFAQQQSRSIKYTTQFALDRQAVKDHAHSTAGNPSDTIADSRSLA